MACIRPGDTFVDVGGNIGMITLLGSRLVGERGRVHTFEPNPDAGLTAQEVRDHVAAHLAAYKVPRVVEFSAQLPREDSGKIFKRLLREPYWADRERAI